MTDRSQVSTDASLKAKHIAIHTGNGPVSSSLFERVVVAPGLEQTHVALPATANTVSLGSLNAECQVGFQWMQSLSRARLAIKPFPLPALTHPFLLKFLLPHLLQLLPSMYLPIPLSRVQFITMAILNSFLAGLLQGLLSDLTQTQF